MSDPWNLVDSEFTWQGDGSSTYNTTRGNNAIAQADWDSTSDFMSNYRPESSNYDFDYPFLLDATDFKTYANASITQLFYTVNMYHDLLYELGFTEKAGNFQASDGDKGGVAGDFVVVNAQDGAGTNNADFSTPPDGQNPRMRMYMWDQTTPGRDGVFEADIVLHEFTHGLSNRLTGGPSNSGCLSTTVAGGMGEGWSDFMATAVRIKVNDTHDTNYVMGAWVTNNPAGIRKYPYSTSMKTNTHVYADINSMNEVHKIGEVWATILYEVLWNLVDAGSSKGITSDSRPTFNADHAPTDGRYLAMQLVMNGMAL
jgi:extracellular elastinolytic metalloproteinase